MALPGGIILADGGFAEAPIREGFTTHDTVEDATCFIVGERGAMAGAIAVPHYSGMSDALVGSPMLAFGDVFYNQIWIIPTSLQATNPKLNTPILFKVWNAFLFDNELLSIDVDEGDDTGLTLALTPGDVLGVLGLRTTSITIDDTAPLTVDVRYTFHFALDDGHLHFSSSRAFVIADVPEQPIVETWQWWTDNIVSDNGTEQRIMLRDAPRRNLRETVQYTEIEALRAQMNLMFGFFKGTLIAPFHQYATRIKEKALAGATALVFNESRTDMRDFGLAFLFDSAGHQIIQLGEVSSDGANIAYPLERDFRAGSMICPAYIVLPGNNSAVNRMNPDSAGSLDMSLTETLPNLPFLRESNAQTLTMFKGLPVLERNAVGNQFEQAYDTGMEVRDYGGAVEVRDPWLHTQLVRPLQYISQRVFNPDDWDWWRVFADYCKGSLNPFYTPTYREDFKLLDAAEPASSDLTIEGSDYLLIYYDHEPFKQIAISSDGGIHYADVVAVEAVGGDNKLSFTPPLPAGEEWGLNQKVSFLLKSRIADDKFVCNHYDTYTQINITLRTVDA